MVIVLGVEGDRSRKGGAGVGGEPRKMWPWTQLKEERQEGQRLRSPWKHSIFTSNDSIKRWTRPRGPNSRFRLGTGDFLPISTYHSAEPSALRPRMEIVKPKTWRRKTGQEMRKQAAPGGEHVLPAPAGTQMSSAARSCGRPDHLASSQASAAALPAHANVYWKHRGFSSEHSRGHVCCSVGSSLR